MRGVTKPLSSYPNTEMISQNFRQCLSYDDVLLVPKKSIVSSRKDVDLSTFLTKKIKLNMPIIPANMDSITESSMAIAIAREGSIGFIHRFLSIEQQVNEVKRVKRSEGLIIENPYTLYPDNELHEALEIMQSKKVSGLLIVDEDYKLKGILTRRDVLCQNNLNEKISNLMTKKVITGKPGISIEDASDILKKNKIEKLPLVDNKGILKGLITSKDLSSKVGNIMASKDSKGRLLVGAAIGVKDDFLERTSALVEAGCDVIVVDIAHGHSENEIRVIKAIKKTFPDIPIVGGNIATSEGALDLISAGADCIKVGVGPGSLCTTRIMTGCGVPQLTAVLDVVNACKDSRIPICADGGLKNSGDIVKALATGASTVMAGSLFAGCEETPGSTFIKNGKKFKAYRGMAGYLANQNKLINEGKKPDVSDFVPEGTEAMVPYKGTVKEVLNHLLGGLRSGISYCGSRNILEMQKNAEFVRITAAGMNESRAHNPNVNE